MKSKEISRDDFSGERSFVIVLDDGEEAFSSITRFCRDENITGASLTAIGAFRQAKLGFFDFSSKTYLGIPVTEQTEVLSAIGDVAVDDEGKPSLHMHAVLGLSDGSTKGGHFISGIVHPTLEVVLRESEATLKRRNRPDLGIALIDL